MCLSGGSFSTNLAAMLVKKPLKQFAKALGSFTLKLLISTTMLELFDFELQHTCFNCFHGFFESLRCFTSLDKYKLDLAFLTSLLTLFLINGILCKEKHRFCYFLSFFKNWSLL